MAGGGAPAPGGSRRPRASGRSPAWMVMPLAAAAAAALALALPTAVPPTGVGPEPAIESEHILRQGRRPPARLPQDVQRRPRRSPRAPARPPATNCASVSSWTTRSPARWSPFDGRGAVTPTSPSPGARSCPAAARCSTRPTPWTTRPAFERFILVSGPGVALDDVVRAAEALAKQPDADERPLRLPTGWRQTDFLIRKGPPAPGTEATP
jgi:hypothetical protein